jgi:CRISPR-associated protein Csx14
MPATKRTKAKKETPKAAPVAKHKEVLVATLGTSPQVVTLMIDELLKRGCNIGFVKVFHMSIMEPAVKPAVEALEKEKAHYKKKGIELDLHVIRDSDNLEIKDMQEEYQAQAVIQTLYSTLKEIKSRKSQSRVHLSLAGGRKSMAAYVLVTAMFLFDREDCCWHLWSKGEIATNGKLHAGKGDIVTAEQVPVLRLQDFPVDIFTTASSDPLTVQKEMDENLSARYDRMKSLEQKLNEPEREVFRLMAGEGLKTSQIAKLLYIPEKGVLRHRTKILKTFKSMSRDPIDKDATFERLAALFAPVIGARIK